MPHFSVLMFHFLRTCGFTWLWECDSNAGDNPTHIDDGNMATIGVADWADVGTPTVKQKVTTPVRQGLQALEIAADAASEGVQSNNLISMRASIGYHVTVWANNDSGASWEVWADNGDGLPVKLGDITSDGSYQEYHFDFTTHSSGNPFIQILSTAAGTIYVDGIIVFESYFEYAGLHDPGTDGSITNPDQFTSASDYTFTVGDIGRYVCIYDIDNPDNSGAYEITGEAGGVVTLDLKSTTGTLTTHATTNLPFRVIDLDDASVPVNVNMDAWIRGVGWGLESPHISKWRFFCRHNIPDLWTSKGVNIWAAPGPTEYDYEDGSFLMSGPSTQRTLSEKYAYAANDGHFWHGGQQQSVTAQSRCFLMMEDDFSFVTAVIHNDGPVQRTHGTFFVGYTGTNIYNPGNMEFDLLASTIRGLNSSAIEWNHVDACWGLNAVTFNFNDFAAPTSILALGRGISADGVFNQTGIQANPFSGDEYMMPITTYRYADTSDVEGSYKPYTVGLYRARFNMTEMVVFDSEQFIHFANGLVWDWNGFDLA